MCKRLVSLLLLMAYAITGTALLPATVTALAVLEGDHDVLIGQTQSGVSLTLHHRPDDFTPCLEDHRNALARVLVRFCRTSGEGDHQLSSARLDANADSEKRSLALISKRQVPVNLSATFQLGRLVSVCARATMRQGMMVTSEVQRGPAFMPVLRTVQMLV